MSQTTTTMTKAKTKAKAEREPAEEAGKTAASVPATQRTLRYQAPRADVWEDADGATLVVDLPGVREDGLDLRVEDDLLVIDGRAELEPQAGRTVYAEWEPANFHRTFSLSEEADRERIEATLRHGVLTVRVPKAEHARPRRIQVTRGG